MYVPVSTPFDRYVSYQITEWNVRIDSIHIQGILEVLDVGP